MGPAADLSDVQVSTNACPTMRITTILLASIALLAAACGESSTETPDPSSLEPTAPASRYSTESDPASAHGANPEPTGVPSNLYLILDDGNVPIENGESYQLNEELEVQMTLDPYPPIGLSAHLVLDLYLTDRLGAPIDDADISLRYDMFDMTHGPFESQMINRGNGHYLASLDLIMFGAWGIETTIRTSFQSEPYQLRNAVIVSLPPE